jgi:hypothetical protein
VGAFIIMKTITTAEISPVWFFVYFIIFLFVYAATYAVGNSGEHYLIKFGSVRIPNDSYWSNYWYHGITAELGYRIPTPIYRHYNQIWLKSCGSLFLQKGNARFPMESLADTFNTSIDVKDMMTIALGVEHKILFRNDKYNGIPYFNWQFGIIKQTATKYKSELPLVGNRNINHKLDGYFGLGLGIEWRLKNKIHCLFDIGLWDSTIMEGRTIELPWRLGTMNGGPLYIPVMFGVIF